MQKQADSAGTGGETSSERQSQGRGGELRARAETALGTVRDKSANAYANSKEKASLAAQRTADSIDANPLVAVAGGLALGAVVAALLPVSRKESELLGPVGSKVGEAARTAARAARETGLQQLDELGLNRDAARTQVSKLLDQALKVAGQAGGAATRAVRDGSRA